MFRVLVGLLTLADFAKPLWTPPTLPPKRGVTHRLKAGRPHQYYVMQRQYVREKLNKRRGNKVPLELLSWTF